MLLNNTYRKHCCLSIATTAAITLQNVTLYVHYQPCCITNLVDFYHRIHIEVAIATVLSRVGVGL